MYVPADVLTGLLGGNLSSVTSEVAKNSPKESPLPPKEPSTLDEIGLSSKV